VSVRHVEIVSKQLNGSSCFFLARSLPSLFLNTVTTELGIANNNGTSLWKFIPNPDLGLLVGFFVTSRKASSSLFDRRRLMTLSGRRRLQYVERDTERRTLRIGDS